MRKFDLIEYLVKKYQRDYEELKDMTKEELEELLDELEDDSDLFPNGRDFDAEDEDGI